MLRTYIQMIAVIIACGLGPAHAISIEIIDKLDIKAIKSIHLRQTTDAFRADVVVQFSTTAKTAIRFQEADFSIIFKDSAEQEIPLGTTQVAELIFPASEEGDEKLQDEKLDVLVGQNNVETISRLIKLFNLIGDPDADFSMILSGSAKVGMQAKRGGWMSPAGKMNIEDFVFHPTIQREVLFK
jgi:hypothetical protein